MRTSRSSSSPASAFAPTRTADACVDVVSRKVLNLATASAAPDAAASLWSDNDVEQLDEILSSSVAAQVATSLRSATQALQDALGWLQKPVEYKVRGEAFSAARSRTSAHVQDALAGLDREPPSPLRDAISEFLVRAQAQLFAEPPSGGAKDWKADPAKLGRALADLNAAQFYRDEVPGIHFASVFLRAASEALQAGHVAATKLCRGDDKLRSEEKEHLRVRLAVDGGFAASLLAHVSVMLGSLGPSARASAVALKAIADRVGFSAARVADGRLSEFQLEDWEMDSKGVDDLLGPLESLARKGGDGPVVELVRPRTEKMYLQSAVTRLSDAEFRELRVRIKTIILKRSSEQQAELLAELATLKGSYLFTSDEVHSLIADRDRRSGGSNKTLIATELFPFVVDARPEQPLTRSELKRVRKEASAIARSTGQDDWLRYLVAVRAAVKITPRQVEQLAQDRTDKSWKPLLYAALQPASQP